MTQSAPNTKALTSRGGERGVAEVGGAPPLGRPLRPMGRPWKRPGPPPELQKRVRRDEGAADGALSCCLSPQCLCPPPASMSSAHFNRGPAYGLSAEVKNKVGPPPPPAHTPRQAMGFWSIPCDLGPEGTKGQTWGTARLPPHPEHPRALSDCWGGACKMGGMQATI